MGKILAMTADSLGAEEVYLADIQQERLADAERFGVSTTIDSGKNDVVERVREQTRGRGLDLVIVAAKDPNETNPHQALSLYFVETGTPFLLILRRTLTSAISVSFQY